MLAHNESVSDLALPALDVRACARRAAVPAAIAGGVVAVAIVAGGQVHAFTGALRRLLDLSPSWIALGAVFEACSLAGYVALLALVAGRAAPRIGLRESAQITLTGAAATRLLPTAGAGGAAVTVWALRRAGLGAQAAARTLLAFFVLLYAVFLASISVSGTVLSLGSGPAHGPVALSAIPAVAAIVAIALGLGLAFCLGGEAEVPASAAEDLRARVRTGARVIGLAVADAVALVRSADLRLAGAAAYWALDAAVLWAMLHAFGSPPALPVVALAYFIGQVANTIPLPGSVSGGMAAVLIAFGVTPALALPAVLAYRTIAVWLPTPAALTAVPALRATFARWAAERERREPAS